MLQKMEGRTFSELTVIKYTHSEKGRRFYECICSCGKPRIVAGNALRFSSVKRCLSCLSDIHKTHGMEGTPTYRIWNGMITRCHNPNVHKYPEYGGRGITVCERWRKFKNFFEDMGERPGKLQLDRIDNDKGYFKENCRWITSKANNQNRRGCVICNCQCRIKRQNNIS